MSSRKIGRASTQVVGPLSELPLYIDDTPAISVMEMRKARRLKLEKGLCAVFVDYLRSSRAGATEPRTGNRDPVSPAPESLG